MSSLPDAGLTASVTDVLMPSFVEGHFRRQQEDVDAVPTCLPAWNTHCRDEGGGIGLARGWYVIVAGATGHGKSLMALNMAVRAMRAGVTPAFVSLEMSTAQLATRLYAILTDTDVRRIERGNSFDARTADDVAYRVAEMKERTGVSFFANREPVFRIEQVQKLMRYWHDEDGTRLFFVDYLQLVGTGDEERIYREVTKVSAGVREFAKRLDVTVVGLSQFNRSTSSNRDAPPSPQGLIGSSSLENDADQVMMLDHSRYVKDLEDDRLARTWAILGKNRHGGTGPIPVLWDYRTLTIREAMPDEEHAWPGGDR